MPRLARPTPPPKHKLTSYPLRIVEVDSQAIGFFFQTAPMLPVKTTFQNPARRNVKDVRSSQKMRQIGNRRVVSHHHHRLPSFIQLPNQTEPNLDRGFVKRLLNLHLRLRHFQTLRKKAERLPSSLGGTGNRLVKAHALVAQPPSHSRRVPPPARIERPFPVRQSRFRPT